MDLECKSHVADTASSGLFFPGQLRDKALFSKADLPEVGPRRLRVHGHKCGMEEVGKEGDEIAQCIRHFPGYFPTMIQARPAAT